MRPPLFHSKPSGRKLYIALSLFLSFALAFMYLEHAWDSLRIDATNETGGTVICKSAFDIMANNTYMIISRAGKVVVMDPYDAIPGPSPDLVTVSHLHGDHYDEEYTSNAQGRTSVAKVDSFETSEMKMYSVPASHSGDSVDRLDPSNVIYVVEIDSLKIAHLGDYGQTRLTDEQRARLNGVDVLIMPCAYYPVTTSSMHNVLTELHPSVIFTTHTDRERLDFLKTYVSDIVVLKERYSVKKSDIGVNTMRLVALEREHGVLLFARYLVYKFAGSPLFRMILALAGLSLVVWLFLRRRKKKKLGIVETA